VPELSGADPSDQKRPGTEYMNHYESTNKMKSTKSTMLMFIPRQQRIASDKYDTFPQILESWKENKHLIYFDLV
jgi:hypothetical protein